MALIVGRALSSNYLRGLYLPTGTEQSASSRMKCSIDIG